MNVDRGERKKLEGDAAMGRSSEKAMRRGRYHDFGGDGLLMCRESRVRICGLIAHDREHGSA